MDSESGRSNPSVEILLHDEPYRFEFFQAVRLLERLMPERLPVGRVTDEGQVIMPGREIVRFGTSVSLRFPPSQVQELESSQKERKGEEDGDGQLRMEVAFMGLTGPIGVLPNHYTELLIDRVRAGDRTMADFLDLFNHRMISFFYRAWEKYRFPVAYERRPNGDKFTSFLFSITGLATRGLTGRMNLRDEGLLCYAGLISQRPHSAGAFAAIVGDYFGVEASVIQFAGQWLPLDAESVSKLGKSNSALGVSAFAGARVWDSQSKFRMKIGPVGYKQFTSFLPNGSAFKPMMELIKFLAGPEFDFDVQLVLKAEEVPGTVLTTRARRRPMLRWNTWLRTRPFEHDDEQVVLAPDSI
ncbi:MAG TPA: type VI secretion system baseplate subunit TssG [Blastocatellia bacterium]|jgi:type VI secretion system protein ImpH|nr:type VI secretion system baseplate subunit TssG [Blastocatellia bacterium]